MRTILVIAGIVLAGATVIAVVQKDKKKDTAPEINQAGGAQVDSPQPSGSQSSAPATNPAHGLAGHRCDLPVGAPLNTASGSGAQVQSPPTIKMNPAPVQSSPPTPAAVPVPSAAGVKINPAHGMPGHRCDIQVGAPLT